MTNRISLFGAFFLLMLAESYTQLENIWLKEEISLNTLQPSLAIEASTATDLVCLAPGGIAVKSLQPGVPLDVVVTVKNISGRALCLQTDQQLITVSQCYDMVIPAIALLEPLPLELRLDTNQTATTKLRLTTSEPFNPAPGCTAFAIMRVWLLDPTVDPIYSEYHDMVISFGENAPVTPQTIAEPKQLLTFLRSSVGNGKITAKNCVFL
ncbi:hypothetical protein [Haliscomenobacter hydrossis]|uniref:Uncharacterized protein n=1 Tax=Haliscomenobacter hydrossis (strain ATCC 27775 / DSM 1100 / LMG 10767 / O) TaxID=760192 RepID=F4KUX3_HALH1|nr:hypothetical protein [Haliscomenobacter hydrossis]AEE48149.1 hypothetical protein Halhy_0236 [Haliscomenobacter hydrossis DSM 1100]